MLTEIGCDVKNHMSVVDKASADHIRYQLTGKENRLLLIQKNWQTVKPGTKEDNNEQSKPKAADKKKKHQTQKSSDNDQQKRPGRHTKQGQQTPQKQAAAESAAPSAKPKQKQERKSRSAKQNNNAVAQQKNKQTAKRPKKKLDKRERRARREARLLNEQQKRENTVVLGSRITVGELADKLGVGAGEIISKLIGLGVMAAINQAIDTEVAQLLAEEYGFEVEIQVDKYEAELVEAVEDKEEDLQLRSLCGYSTGSR